MNADKLAELNEILKQPLRQKILLQLGQHDSLTFEELLKNLKIQDLQELSNQIEILGDLIGKTNSETSPIKPEQSENLSEEYALTEKGHDALDAMIAYPELKSMDYPQKPKPKWFMPYWIAIFASTIIIVGIVIPFFGHQSFERAIFYLAIALLIEGLGFFARIKTPSMRTNRIMYIVLFGGFFGCWFSIAALIFLTRIFDEFNVFVLLTFIGCFALGGLIGDLIGKFRHYKGPEQYSP
jgi:hypothetical protein